MQSLVVWITVLFGFTQLVSVFLLLRRRQLSKLFDQKKSPMAGFKEQQVSPGISVVTTLKGNDPDQLNWGIKSILNQRYDGPIEFIIVVKTSEEKVYADAARIIAENPSSIKIQLLTNPTPVGANPRSAKMAYGFNLTTHPWIYWHCVDTVPDLHHFRDAMRLTQGDWSKYVTAFPVNVNPKSFGAKIETLGLNVEVVRYFLFSTVFPKHTVAYGGSTLFHRDLLAKAGGLAQTLDTLTDDEVLAQAFKKVGATCYLAPHSARVSQERISFRDFWNRQVRWFMIGRHHLTGLFMLTPFIMVGQWFLVSGLVFKSTFLIKMGLLVFFMRMIQGFLFQYFLGTPKRDWLSIWTLPLYDLLFPIIWVTALLKRQVGWGGTVMKLGPNGILIRPVI